MPFERRLRLLGRPQAVPRLGERSQAKRQLVIEPANLRRQRARRSRSQMMFEIEISQKQIHVVPGHAPVLVVVRPRILAREL